MHIDEFSSDRVTALESTDTAASVSSTGTRGASKSSMGAGTTSTSTNTGESKATKEEDEYEYEQIEGTCNPCETLIIDIMEEVSSKKSSAFYEMHNRLRTAVLKDGFMRKHDVAIMVSDFEFYKYGAELYLTNPRMPTISNIAGGHFIKNACQQLIKFFEPMVMEPMMKAINIRVDSPAYNSRVKGTNIKRTVQECLRQSFVALVALGDLFLKEQGVQLLQGTTVTYAAYVADPSMLLDPATVSLTYTLDYDGRVVHAPVDKHAKEVVEAFEIFVQKKAGSKV
jgi:hypothetical protein